MTRSSATVPGQTAVLERLDLNRKEVVSSILKRTAPPNRDPDRDPDEAYCAKEAAPICNVPLLADGPEYVLSPNPPKDGLGDSP